MDPASPSRLVPGAWPASPSPSRHRCSSTGGTRLRQYMNRLSYHKISPRRVIHSHFDSKPVLPTSSADNTPTSFTFDDLSLQSSLANTSISSAYMNPFLENSPSKPEQGESLQCQDEVGLCQSSSLTRGIDIDICCESPSPPADQTYLSLPEIPDLSSLSSLQEDFHTTQGNFNAADSEVFCFNIDEDFLQMQASSFGCRSLDTSSSSSIRFRRTEVPPSGCGVQALQVPQPNGRNSWLLSLPPVSAFFEERPSLPLQLTRTSLGIRMSESECQNTDPACTNVRRSWMIGNFLPVPSNGLAEEEASTRRYANEVLDHAFHMYADGSMFTLGIPGVDIPPTPPLKVVANPRRRSKISHIAKRLVHRLLNKPRNEDTIIDNPTNQDPNPIRHLHHGRYSSETEDLKLQVRDSVLPHGDPGPEGQSSQACTLQNTQSRKDDPESRVREFKLSDIKIRKHSAVSSPPGATFRCPINAPLQHLSAIPNEGPSSHRTTSENQHFLSCDIFKLEKPKRNHRRSFLRRVGI